MDHNIRLTMIVECIDELIADPTFINELTGEDEGFIETVLDFFARLEDQFTPVEYVEDDPILWRANQDAETDWLVKLMRHPKRYKSAAIQLHTTQWAHRSSLPINSKGWSPINSSKASNADQELNPLTWRPYSYNNLRLLSTHSSFPI